MSQFSPLSRGLDEIAARVAEVLGAHMLSQAIAFGELTIDGRAGDIVEVVTLLRDDPRAAASSPSSTSAASTGRSARSASTSSITC